VLAIGTSLDFVSVEQADEEPLAATAIGEATGKGFYWQLPYSLYGAKPLFPFQEQREKYRHAENLRLRQRAKNLETPALLPALFPRQDEGIGS